MRAAFPAPLNERYRELVNFSCDREKRDKTARRSEREKREREESEREKERERGRREREKEREKERGRAARPPAQMHVDSRKSGKTVRGGTSPPNQVMTQHSASSC